MSDRIKRLKKIIELLQEEQELLLERELLQKEKERLKKYPMCKSQLAQIDCRKTNCTFYDTGGECTNVSPALTLNADGKFLCWSEEDYLVDDDKKERELKE